MNKTRLKIILLLVSLLLVGNVVWASEVTGNLNTGISSPDIGGIVIAPPVASPQAGVYPSAQNVTLAAPGATSVRYTTNGSLPTCSLGTLYSGAVVVNSSLVLRAVACFPNNQASTVASYSYTIDIQSLTNPPSGGGGGGAPHKPAVSVATTTPGLVLGASTVNWNALTPDERAGIIATLRQQLALIIQMFEELKLSLS